jgi:hypothetical protein
MKIAIVVLAGFSWAVGAILWSNLDAHHQETARMCLQHKFEPKICLQFVEVP